MIIFAVENMVTDGVLQASNSETEMRDVRYNNIEPGLQLDITIVYSRMTIRT